MLVKRWEPFITLGMIDGEMARMWRHGFQPMHMRTRFWGGNSEIALDVYKEGDDLVIRAALPGVKPEEVEVTITEDTLTIAGERKPEKEVKEEDYLHREYRSGSFRRVVALPHGLDAKKADASYENGILTINVPRSEESIGKTLKVNVKS